VSSLEREKREVMQDIGKYSSNQGDPFYNLTHAQASLMETDDHYIIETKVPDYERDSVKVIVQDGRVVVQGQRRFQDRINDGTSKLSTSNYQTFRQEIPLDRPIVESMVDRQWNNGILTTKIRKA
jgi:HSP20 family protein